MANNHWRQAMCKRSFCLPILIALHATPAIAEPPELATANNPSLHASLLALQARFARLQRHARPHDLHFELQLSAEGHASFEKYGDGIVWLPENWILAEPDTETLDFLMLLSLAHAVAREPSTQTPSTATKILAATLGYIGANAADNRKTLKVAAPHFTLAALSSKPAPALRALNWTTVNGGCETRVISGLRKLEQIDGPTGHESREILKALGPVAWTPDDHCLPL